MDIKCAESVPSEFSSNHGLSRRALQQAVDFLESNLGRCVSLQEVAGAARVSRFHFARKFRLSTGTSPKKYLMKIRIERAKQLLIEGNMPIGSIAADLGFADQSHFVRNFRRLVGQTPRSYAQGAIKTVDRLARGSSRPACPTDSCAAAAAAAE